MYSSKLDGKSRGFTLIEVVISIAVLAICSIFILQMFVTSSQLNRNARDIDRANSILSSIIEGFSTETAAPRETNTYYDAEWNECIADAARFLVTVRVAHLEDGPSVPVALGEEAQTACGALYQIECTVLHLNVQGANLPVAQASSCVYFPDQEGAA